MIKEKSLTHSFLIDAHRRIEQEQYLELLDIIIKMSLRNALPSEIFLSLALVVETVLDRNEVVKITGKTSS